MAPPYIFFGCFIAFIVLVSWLNRGYRHRFDSLVIVKQGVAYPNNFHVLGVGYYHAASRVWHPHPWNEFREGRGYYCDGKWQSEPDQRMVASSEPDPQEIPRVNKAWRNADPDRAAQFWETVDREGFGTAIRRSEGS